MPYNSPQISVLLPVYNASKFINQCLDSIKQQTFKDFEVVIVNDGSIDDTLEKIVHFCQSDCRFKVVNLDMNQGIVAALNIGIEHCNGYWIARMDGDDIMYSQRLEKQFYYMQQHPEIGILGTQVQLIRDDAEITEGQHHYIDWGNRLLKDKDIKDEIFAESPIIHPTFFLKKDTYKQLNGYIDNPWVEDYDILFRAFNEGIVFGKLAEKLLIKRDHPARVVRNDIRSKRKAMFTAKAHYFKASAIYSNKKRYLIIGTGAAAKQLYASLIAEDITVDGFVNNDHSNTKKSLKGLPIYKMTETNLTRFLTEHQHKFLMLAVGVPNGKVKLEMLLKQFGLNPRTDYLKFI